MQRYSVIRGRFAREFLLLQGTGCRWKQCTFCDYYDDVCPSPYETNKSVLDMVTGEFGVLDIINSGSALELDPETIAAIQEVVKSKGICLLCCTDTPGDTRERVLKDIALAEEHFEYYSLNLFCPNSTSLKRNEEMAQWVVSDVYPSLLHSSKAEVLIDNTDLGVG